MKVRGSVIRFAYHVIIHSLLSKVSHVHIIKVMHSELNETIQKALQCAKTC